MSLAEDFTAAMSALENDTVEVVSIEPTISEDSDIDAFRAKITINGGNRIHVDAAKQESGISFSTFVSPEDMVVYEVKTLDQMISEIGVS